MRSATRRVRFAKAPSVRERAANVTARNTLANAFADDWVDADFGTGAVKVTPAHDPNDFQIGLRHNLPRINVMTEDGRMSDEAPEAYQGLDRFKCREKLIDRLDASGLLEKTDDHDLAIAHCYRCKTVIEPYLSDQGFVKVGPLAAKY